MIQKWIADHFYAIQIGVGILLLTLWTLARIKNDSQSNFKVREADLQSKNRTSKNRSDLASATLKTKNNVFQLTGIRIDGLPHEILGLPAHASEDEIQKTYRELIKRYHPDKVGPPDSPQWQDAQSLADAITQARNQMLQKYKK